MNEITGNNFDTSAIVEELQILNKGVLSNGEKLDQINEYLILKEQKEKEDKEAAEEKEQKQTEEAELRQQEQSEETDTYTELLTDIRDQSVLTNNLIAGQIFFTGMIFGIILLNVLWNRFIR